MMLVGVGMNILSYVHKEIFVKYVVCKCGMAVIICVYVSVLMYLEMLALHLVYIILDQGWKQTCFVYRPYNHKSHNLKNLKQ